MSHAKHVLLALGGAALVAVSVACGSDLAAGFDSEGSNAPSGSGSDAGFGGSSSGAPQRGPTATGVLLVHAAGFPSFRLCFENFPELPPQPDANVMPEANVVGVEIGSLVRIDPLKAPGKVYVIDESQVRSAPGESEPVKCGELVAPPEQKTSNTLVVNRDYHVTNAIEAGLGDNRVSVLAISGCGYQALVDSLGLSTASCGPDYDPVRGNLQAKVVDLTTTAEGASPSSLPVQLFQLSQALDSFKGPTGSLSVTFGDLRTDAGTLGQVVETGALFTGGPQTSLQLDQTDPTVFGAWGFRVVATNGGQSARLDQSLAEVQELSSPRQLPTEYYKTASNYALLLLGDPTLRPTFADGGANPSFNPRQALHILAVPVVDPSKADAGADADAPAGDGDGGT